MGNTSSHSRRHHHHHHPPSAPPGSSQPAQSQINTNQYVYSAPPGRYPNPNLPLPHYPFGPGYYRYPTGGCPPPVMIPYVEKQKTITIKNDVNIKKDSIRVLQDTDNPGEFILSFSFDATSPGRITVVFFGKEGEDCNVIATKESMFKPVSVSFEQGLGQEFRQPSGTGIEFSMFEEVELKKEDNEGVYPLMVKAEACPPKIDGSSGNSAGNSQITLAVFDKKDNKDVYAARVVKQILWVGNTRYELQEIYGIGNYVDVESDGNDPGKECVICMSEPRDTTFLPCRHMCMCSGCAKLLQFRTKRCPICRQPFESLLEIKVNDGTDA